jgi:hypothetical protein
MDEGHHDHMVLVPRGSRIRHECSMLESPIGLVISRAYLTPTGTRVRFGEVILSDLVPHVLGDCPKRLELCDPERNPEPIVYACHISQDHDTFIPRYRGTIVEVLCSRSGCCF